MNVSKALWAIGSLIGAQQAVKVARKFEINDLLGYIGLQRHRSATSDILPAIGLVTLGAAVGAGVALLVAPSSGVVLRKRLSERVDKLTDRIEEMQKPKNTSPNEYHAASS